MWFFFTNEVREKLYNFISEVNTFDFVHTASLWLPLSNSLFFTKSLCRRVFEKTSLYSNIKCNNKTTRHRFLQLYQPINNVNKMKLSNKDGIYVSIHSSRKNFIISANYFYLKLILIEKFLNVLFNLKYFKLNIIFMFTFYSFLF